MYIHIIIYSLKCSFVYYFCFVYGECWSFSCICGEQNTCVFHFQFGQTLLSRPPPWLEHNPSACRERGREREGGGQPRDVKRLTVMLVHTHWGICLSLSSYVPLKNPRNPKCTSSVLFATFHSVKWQPLFFNDAHAAPPLLWKVQSGSPHALSASLWLW